MAPRTKLAPHRRLILRADTQERPFACHLCTLTFPRADVRAKHVKNFHAAPAVTSKSSKTACAPCRRRKVRCDCIQNSSSAAQTQAPNRDAMRGEGSTSAVSSYPDVLGDFDGSFLDAWGPLDSVTTSDMDFSLFGYFDVFGTYDNDMGSFREGDLFSQSHRVVSAAWVRSRPSVHKHCRSRVIRGTEAK